MRLLHWWFTPMEPARLGAMRAVVGIYALVYLLARANHLLSPLRLSASRYEPVGVARLWSEPMAGWLLGGWLALTLVLCLLFILGWAFRFTGPLFAFFLLVLLTYRNSWSMTFHTENLLVLHVAILGVSASADAFCWRRPGRSAPHERYGWPIRLSCVVVVLAYVLAAVAKLERSGFAWLESDWLRYWVAYDNLRKLELGHIHSPLGVALLPYAWVFVPLSVLSVLVELAAPLALLGRVWAVAWVSTAMAFHWGVLALMAIAFPYQMSGVAFACFFPVDAWIAKLRQRSWHARGFLPKRTQWD